MCTVSAVSDNWKEKFPTRWPDFPIPDVFKDYSPTTKETYPKVDNKTTIFQPVSKEEVNSLTEEFHALKKEVEELKKLLEAAKKFDEATGQHDCEMEDKVVMIKKVAEMVGVDMGSVFK